MIYIFDFTINEDRNVGYDIVTSVVEKMGTTMVVSKNSKVVDLFYKDLDETVAHIDAARVFNINKVIPGDKFICIWDIIGEFKSKNHKNLAISMIKNSSYHDVCYVKFGKKETMLSDIDKFFSDKFFKNCSVKGEDMNDSINRVMEGIKELLNDVNTRLNTLTEAINESFSKINSALLNHEDIKLEQKINRDLEALEYFSLSKSILHPSYIFYSSLYNKSITFENKTELAFDLSVSKAYIVGSCNQESYALIQDAIEIVSMILPKETIIQHVLPANEPNNLPDLIMEHFKNINQSDLVVAVKKRDGSMGIGITYECCYAVKMGKIVLTLDFSGEYPTFDYFLKEKKE